MKVPLGHERRIDELDGLGDVFQCLADICRSAGVIHYDSDADAIAAATIGQLSLGRLVDLNRGWHRAHQEGTRRLAEQSAALPVETWPPMLPDRRVDFGDVHAVELCSVGELVEEGRALQHCVASYHRLCFAGTSRIVSLRSPDDAARSTLEFRMLRRREKEPLRVCLVQHYGYANGRPSEKDAHVAQQLLKVLRRKRVAEPWPALPCPESADEKAQRILDEHMESFMLERLPGLADLLRARLRRAA